MNGDIKVSVQDPRDPSRHTVIPSHPRKVQVSGVRILSFSQHQSRPKFLSQPQSMSLSLLKPASPFLVPSMTQSDSHMLGNTPVSACVYKKVARKVCLVPASLPEDFCMVCRIPSDPFLSMPALSPHPPEFVPVLRLMEE